MPCKLGIRDSIEAGKKWNDEQREWDLHDPYRKLWLRLVHRVYETSGGFDRLSEPEKKYFAVISLEGEVFNGGFDQYFFNDSASYYIYAVLGLQEMGAIQSLTLLNNAKQCVFGNDVIPEHQAARRAILLNQTSSATTRILDQLDREFWKDPDGLLERSQAFATAHGFVDSAETF